MRHTAPDVFTYLKSACVLAAAVACSVPQGGEGRPAPQSTGRSASVAPDGDLGGGALSPVSGADRSTATDAHAAAATAADSATVQAAVPTAAAGPITAEGGPDPSAPETAAPAPAPGPVEVVPWVRIDRGEGQMPLLVPRGEELRFRVRVDIGVFGDIEAGHVTLSSGVERYVTGLPGAGNPAQKRPEIEMAWIKSFATGGYGNYSLEHELHTRLLPQVWPRVYYTDTNSGTEHRRRELKLGLYDGQPTTWYRGDGHCKGCQNREHFLESTWLWGEPQHCGKCKRAEHRIWRTPTSRSVPPETVDMLSAVYLARSMLSEGLAETRFPLIDQRKLWDVHVRAGRDRRIETPAGIFDCREVLLSTSLPPGEPKDDSGFEGMFGIRGTIQIWLDAQSGVPVRIEGALPVPVIGELDVRVELQSYRGTPENFVPVRS